MNQGTATATSPARQPDDAFAAALRGFGPLGVLAMLIVLAGNVVFTPLTAILVLVWAHVSRTPWKDLGYVRPKSWIAALTVGVIFGSAFKLVMKAVVMPLLGAEPVNHVYHFLAGNPAAIPWALYAMVIGAGFGEETFFRGYMFERLGRLFGKSAGSKFATVILTSTVFALAHYPVQRLAGTEQAAVVGLVFGTIFAKTGRIWMLMCAHAAFDLTAYALIYWNFELPVAHLVFR